MKDDSIKICDFGLSRTDPGVFQMNEVPHDHQSKKEVGVALYGNRRERRKEKRHLSPHIVSRVYRPPEVALLHPQYGKSVDVWSFGCIMAELLQCEEHYKLE